MGGGPGSLVIERRWKPALQAPAEGCIGGGGVEELEARKQDASRQFGPGPTAVWTAYRKVNPAGATAPTMSATEFMRAGPASNFFPLTEPR